MIVFWKGFGLITAALPVVGLILAQIVASMATPGGDIWWRPALVLFITAAISLVVYLWLLKTTDTPTRKADPLLFCHHLMFIPMGLHPIIFLLIGLFQWHSFAAQMKPASRTAPAVTLAAFHLVPKVSEALWERSV